jgi:predicted nucleotidyltransferase
MTRQLYRAAPAKPKIDVPQDAITDFCQRHAVRKLALFGSVLRDDFRPDSDVDVLVEFEPGHVPGLAFFAMQEELTELLKREVELHTPAFLSPYFRRAVERAADVRYPQR